MSRKLGENLKQVFSSLLEASNRALPSLKWPLLIFLSAYFLVIFLWKIPEFQVPSTGINIKERVQLENEARKTLAQIIGGGFLLVGIYLTWRRIRATERTLELTQGQLDVAREGQITERFTRAIDQLGGDKPLEVRLGAIYALERIARDSEKDHWPIMEILTAYVRTHAPLLPKQTKDLETLAKQLVPKEKAPDAKAQKEAKPKPRVDIQAILTVIGRRSRIFLEGENEGLDLSRTDLRGAELIAAKLAAVVLEEAQLDGAILGSAYLALADLEKASLKDADLSEAHLEGAFLSGASLAGANLSRAYLNKARLIRANLEGAFLGEANLKEAILVDSNLKDAFLMEANLEKARLSGANLRGANLSDAVALCVNVGETPRLW